MKKLFFVLLCGLLSSCFFCVSFCFSQENTIVEVLDSAAIKDGIVISDGPRVVWKTAINKELSDGLVFPVISKENSVLLVLKAKEKDVCQYLTVLDSQTGNVKLEQGFAEKVYVPVIFEGKVFCGAQNNKVYIYSEETGELLEERNEEWCDFCIKNVPSKKTEKVNYLFFNGWLSAFDNTKNEYLWKIDSGNGFNTAPIYDEENVYLATFKGDFYGFDISSGEEKWKTHLGEDIFFVKPLQYEDNLVLLWCENKQERKTADLNITLTVLNAETGEINFSKEWKVSQAVSWPLIFKDRLFLSIGNTLFSYDLEEGKELWRFASKNQIFPAIREEDNNVIVFDGAQVNYRENEKSMVYCLDVETGDIVWSVEKKTGVKHLPFICHNALMICSPKGNNEGNSNSELLFLSTADGSVQGKLVLGEEEVINDSLEKNAVWVTKEEDLLFSTEEKHGKRFIYKVRAPA